MTDDVIEEPERVRVRVRFRVTQMVEATVDLTPGDLGEHLLEAVADAWFGSKTLGHSRGEAVLSDADVISYVALDPEKKR